MAGTVLSIPPALLLAHFATHRSDSPIHVRPLFIRLMRKAAILVFLPSWFVVLVAGLRSIGDAYSSTVMFRTPLLVFVVVSGFLAANTARSGLEVIPEFDTSSSGKVPLAGGTETMAMTYHYGLNRDRNSSRTPRIPPPEGVCQQL